MATSNIDKPVIDPWPGWTKGETAFSVKGWVPWECEIGSAKIKVQLLGTV